MSKTIPKDLKDSLSKPKNRQMTLSSGEIRQLTFVAPDKLKLTKFTVNSSELSTPLESDPEEQKQYSGYSLVCECNDYSPKGVLVWFPEIMAYGSADIDHQRIIIFPGVTWADILRTPNLFINAQWYPESVPHKEVNPWL